MDVASMRLMWRILSSVTPGRSLLLTTHSMAEAYALASRAAVVAGKLLATWRAFAHPDAVDIQFSIRVTVIAQSIIEQAELFGFKIH